MKKGIALGKESFVNRTNAFNAYVRSISLKAQRMTREEEAELAAQIQKGGVAGQRAQEHLVTANLLFVVSVAMYYSNRCKGNIDVMDLIDEGNEAMNIAAKSFDGSYGCRFTSYAVSFVRDHILNFIDKYGSIVYVPRNVKRKTQQYDSPVYLDEPYYEDSETIYGDMIDSDCYADTYLNEADCKHAVHEAMKPFKAKDAYILCRTYGIDDPCECEHNYTDIASDLNLNPETVRLKANAVLKKLRKSAILREYMAA